MPEEIETLAFRFIETGGWFEAEILTTGQVSLTACQTVGKEPQDIAIRVVDNGPPVLDAVAELIHEAVKWRGIISQCDPARQSACAEDKDSFEAPDALGVSGTVALVHLDSLAVPAVIMELPKREAIIMGIALWLGVVVAAVGCVALASVAFGEDQMIQYVSNAHRDECADYMDKLLTAWRQGMPDIPYHERN